MKPITLIENAIFSTIRIEANNTFTNKGSIGTGFLYGYRINPEKMIPFLVTNRHVVKEANEGIINFSLKKSDTEADLEKYENIKITDFDKIWIYPEDENLDLAFTPIADILNSCSLPQGYFYRTIEQSITPNEAQLTEFDAYEDIIFIGYPDGRWDNRHNLPIIRSGTTASPVYIDFQKRPVFLIDCSAFPGSSGSPVFKYNKGMITDKRGNIRTGNELLFLGILTSSYITAEYKEVELINDKRIPAVPISEKIDIGEVIKAKKLLEEIEKFISRNT